MSQVITTAKDWVSAAQATGMLGCCRATLWRHARLGAIRTREGPGKHRYWRADIERMAAPPAESSPKLPNH